MNDSAKKSEKIVYVIPMLLTGALLAIYCFFPDFYLKYILSGLDREAQAVETITFFSALFSAIILWKNAWLLKKSGRFNGAVWIFAIIGLSAFFFAGEESSWGQSYFYWKTPEFYDCTSLETNLHNSPIPVQSIGGLYLVLCFILLPFLIRKKIIKVPHDWLLAVPENTVSFCMIYAFLWKTIKNISHYIYSKPVLMRSPFYVQFVEQINEQKEMLVSVTLLIYAIYIDTKVKNNLTN